MGWRSDDFEMITKLSKNKNKRHELDQPYYEQYDATILTAPPGLANL